MNNTHPNIGPSSPSTAVVGRRSIANSLFGGAILATVATSAVGQVTYFATASALNHGTVTSGYVVLGGNLAVGDGGGGALMPGPPGCLSGDFGIVFPDGNSHCFYRADPTYSVREWGARCDVVSVNAAGAAIWNPGTPTSTEGTLIVPTNLLPTPLSVAPGANPRNQGHSLLSTSAARHSLAQTISCHGDSVGGSLA